MLGLLHSKRLFQAPSIHLQLLSFHFSQNLNNDVSHKYAIISVDFIFEIIAYKRSYENAYLTKHHRIGIKYTHPCSISRVKQNLEQAVHPLIRSNMLLGIKV